MQCKSENICIFGHNQPITTCKNNNELHDTIQDMSDDGVGAILHAAVGYCHWDYARKRQHMAMGYQLLDIDNRIHARTISTPGRSRT